MGKGHNRGRPPQNRGRGVFRIVKMQHRRPHHPGGFADGSGRPIRARATGRRSNGAVQARRPPRRPDSGIAIHNRIAIRTDRRSAPGVIGRSVRTVRHHILYECRTTGRSSGEAPHWPNDLLISSRSPIAAPSPCVPRGSGPLTDSAKVHPPPLRTSPTGAYSAMDPTAPPHMHSAGAREFAGGGRAHPCGPQVRGDRPKRIVGTGRGGEGGIWRFCASQIRSPTLSILLGGFGTHSSSEEMLAFPDRQIRPWWRRHVRPDLSPVICALHPMGREGAPAWDVPAG